MREAIIIGGPNGAGKSTFALELQEIYDHLYLSADLIAAEINPANPAAARLKAGRRFLQRLGEVTEKGESFIVESTLAGKTFVRFIRELENAGYETRITFVYLDSPELCVRRVKGRTQRGGHDVPVKDIIRRFYRSKQNFWRTYRHLAKRWHLFYNARESFQEVASGQRAEYEVSDETLFELFMQDIETR